MLKKGLQQEANPLLSIKNIKKKYVTGELTQTALDNVSLNFRDNEFVAILGPSGSGKTTLLNVIGGLDRYDSGDLIINGISTKKYKDRDWDSYRNHTIGFVFQSYNLIPHQTVLANVELALTISGVSRSERKKRAKEALQKVGLGDQLHKRPNQMSGGQMQRVAIARALVNDPDILLADEPTGALDSETSVQVMDLLNEVARDRLVIMVTHNPELADRYANRIVRLSDGKIIDDSNPFNPKDSEQEEPQHKNMGKSSMSFLTSLSLSFNNLRTKKGRTILTSFAGSIGIIGIALIQSLSAGVNAYIRDIQRDTMASYPVTIEAETIDLNSMMSLRKDTTSDQVDHDMSAVYANPQGLQALANMSTTVTKNNLTKFKQYLDNPDSEIHQYIGKNGIIYNYAVSFGLFSHDSTGRLVNADGSTLVDEELKKTSVGMMISMGTSRAFSSSASTKMMMGVTEVYSQLLTKPDGTGISDAITDNYDVIYGRMPRNYDEMVLTLDSNNEVAAQAMYDLGLLPTDDYRKILRSIDNNEKTDIPIKKLDYQEICSKEFTLLPACDLFMKNASGGYTDISTDTLAIEGKLKDGIKIKITGIIKPKEGTNPGYVATALGYTKALTDYLIDYTNNSEIVKAQMANPSVNVLNGVPYLPKNDDEKAEGARKYIASMTTRDKAALIMNIYTSMQQETSQRSVKAETSSLSMPDIQKMTDEQRAAIVDAFLAQADSENTKKVLVSIYEGYISVGNYDDTLKMLGVVSKDTPSSISLYADSFEDKEKITECIDRYNKTVGEEDKITYTDLVGLLMESVTTIINIISYVLMAFVAVSLIVSSIMIGIITYISVLERTKEIGILRAIGASKKNISRVFNAETFIIGLFSGILGILVSLLLLIPINIVIHAIAGMDTVNAFLPFASAITLVILSVLLTLIGGIIPSRIAAKKDPVIALRTE